MIGFIKGNHSLTGDPRFLDALFHLNNNSPAIDSGTIVPIYSDFDGNLRPFDGDSNGSAEWDIGAYEFGSFAPPQQYCGDSICNNGESCSSCSSDCGTCSPEGGGSTGGGGGSGGGTTTGNGTNNGTNSCTPSWGCGLWTDCITGKQSRDCYDLNNCGIIEGKPVETKDCGAGVGGGEGGGGIGSQITPALKNFFAKIKNVLTTRTFLATIIVFVVVFIVVIIGLITRIYLRKKKETRNRTATENRKEITKETIGAEGLR